jgi:hypothetical protein
VSELEKVIIKQETKPPVPTSTNPPRKAKIVSIGMFKTGTRTLMECFRTLGFSTSIYTFNQERLARWCAGEPYLDIEDVQDEPVFAFWRQIAEAHPDARFVMTIRPFEAWFKSCSKNFRDPKDVRIENGRAISVAREGKLPRRLHLEELLKRRNATVTPALEWLLGIHGGGLDESREFYKRVYVSHLAEVQAYFKDQGDRLLIWDLTDPEFSKWEPLCEWLGVDVPPVDFPWINKTKDRFKWVEDAKEEQKKNPSNTKLHVNPNLFQRVRAMDVQVGDVTAVTNQIITAVSHKPKLDGMKPVVKLWSNDKTIVLDPYYQLWVHRRKKNEPKSS